MSQTIIKYDQFRPTNENTTFGDVRPNKNGQGKNVRLAYNGSSPYISTQKLRNPFGFSRGKEGTQQYNKKFTCTLSFDLETAKGKQFRDGMAALEQLVADEAYEKRVEWGLGKTKKEARDRTREEVRRMMTPLVKYAIDKETEEVISDYPPTFRVTFNTRNNEESGEVEAITSEVYDQDGTRMKDIDETTIKSNSHAKVLMYANAVWVTPSGFGVNWRIRQIKVYPGDGLPTGRCLLPDDEEDSDDESPAPSRSSAPAPSRKPAVVSSMDDDEDDDDEAETGASAERDEDEDEDEDKPKKLTLRR